MTTGSDEEELLRRAMSILGSRKSKKKTKAARENVKKAHEARRKKSKENPSK
jgi:hypothetical protein